MDGAPIDTQYEDLLRRVLEQGTPKADRTGTGTVSLFGERLRYDLSERLPAGDDEEGALPVGRRRAAVVPARRQQRRLAAGATASRSGTSGPPEGELGPVYGVQWRSWPTPDGGSIDQLSGMLDTLRTDPDSRRMIVSAWNVAALPEMALAPCHALFQFYVADGRLSCQLYQRSADMFLGVPFNIASYALLTRMVADQVGLEPGRLHLGRRRLPHLQQPRRAGREQLSREVLPFPTLEIAPGAVAVRLRLRALHGARLPTRTRRSGLPWPCDVGRG